MEFLHRFPKCVSRALLAVALVVGLAGSAWAQGGRPFITRWKASQDEIIKIPIGGTGYQVTWYKEGSADKHPETVSESTPKNPYTFTAPEEGVYVVEIGPAGVESLQMINWEASRRKGTVYGSKKALLSIEQWGDVQWKSLANAFHGCHNMTMNPNAGRPNLSQVTNLNHTFCECSRFNGAIGDWDVSNVTSLISTFEECHIFNQPLTNWNVSKVTNMNHLFGGCHAFNQPLGNWDMSQVRNMRFMFANCDNFNQPIGGWDVSRVTRMDGMFWNCHVFNQPLSGWRVNQMISMSEIFTNCKSFDQPLSSWRFEDASSLGLGHSGLSVENYSSSLINWATMSNLDASFILHAEGMVYDDGAIDARKRLIGEDVDPAVTRWKIIGDKKLTLAFQRSNIVLYENDEYTIKVLLGENIAQGELTCQSSNSSKVDVLRVDGLAVRIKGIEAGEARLTLKMEATGSQPAMTAICDVLVKAVPVESLELSESDMRIKVGEEKLLLATVKPDRANKKNITWSMEPEGIVSLDKDIDNNAKLVGFRPGKTTVIATAKNGLKASCLVTVVQDATSIELKPTELQMAVGDTPVQLEAIVKPEDATDKTVKWTVEQTEGFISVEEGVVTAIKAGEAKVTATTHNGKSASCKVVITQGVESVTVEPATLTMAVGSDPQKLVATVLPKDATKREVSWRAEPEGIISVDGEGTVTPIKGGQAKVIASVANGKSAACDVTVTQDVTELRIDPTSLTLRVNDNPQTLTVTVLPEDATDKTVTWSSEPEGIVSVSGTGIVTPVKGGVTKVIATAKSGVRAECEVTVMQAASSITLEPSSLTIRIGDTPVPLVATVLPEDATDKSIRWTVEPEGIVSVDYMGVVTALKVGKAKVIATTHNNMSDECEVTVKDPSDAASLTAVEALPAVVVTPNPFDEMLTVRNASEVQHYALIATDGRTVAQGYHHGGEVLTMGTAHLPRGMYVLQLHGRQGSRSIKLIK